MANPFKLPKIKGAKALDDKDINRQLSLPTLSAQLPSDKMLPVDDDTPKSPLSPRAARFRRLAGILGPRKS